MNFLDVEIALVPTLTNRPAKPKPSRWGHWRDWLAGEHHRGVTAGAVNDQVVIGLALASEAIDEAMAVSIIPAAFTPAAARRIAAKIIRAADEAEAHPPCQNSGA